VTACNLCGTEIEPGAHLRWRKDGYDIVECPRCGLLFRAELPTREELDAVYDETYFRALTDAGAQGYLDYVGEEHWHRENARRRLERLERLTPIGRLLDIGAAAGFFVDEAGGRGWQAQGLDVSTPMVTWGREHLGVHLDLGDVAEVTLPEAAFDAVTMWDYIEHSRDPAGDLDAARAALRPGGILVVSTGDAAALAARLSGSRWHLLTPRHHNYFFTRATISALLERHRFRVLALGHPGAHYPLSYLCFKLRTLVDARPVRAVATRVEGSSAGKLALPVNLFDIITVIAVADRTV
jgi:2-polyprenyl-3-methyl-5-hydroxy-6-metoxy-1,4-benzoquinol methylase